MPVKWSFEAKKWVIDFTYEHPLTAKRQRCRKVTTSSTKREAEAQERLERSRCEDPEYWRSLKALGVIPKASEDEGGLTWVEFVERWLGYKRSGLKHSTYVTYEQICRTHLTPALNDVKLEKLTKERVDLLLSGLRVSAKTRQNIASVLRSALDQAQEWGLVNQPPPKVKVKRAPQPSWHYLTQGELEALLDASETSRPMTRAVIQCLALTGMRLGEVCALQWSDVDYGASVIRVQRSSALRVVASTKSGLGRTVPMTTRLQQELELWQSKALQGPWVFSRDGHQPIARANVADGIICAMIRAHIPPEKHGIHILRHTYASYLVAQGVPLRSVQQILGHASVTQTERYAHLAPDHFGGALEALKRL